MKHRFDYKTKKRYKIKKIPHTGIRTQTRSIVTQRAPNELQRQSVRLLLRAVMNRHIYIYLHIYFSTPASRVPLRGLYTRLAVCIATAMSKRRRLRLNGISEK